MSLHETISSDSVAISASASSTVKVIFLGIYFWRQKSPSPNFPAKNVPPKRCFGRAHATLFPELKKTRVLRPNPKHKSAHSETQIGRIVKVL
jgi:hypothetical protein